MPRGMLRKAGESSYLPHHTLITGQDTVLVSMTSNAGRQQLHNAEVNSALPSERDTWIDTLSLGDDLDTLVLSPMASPSLGDT